MPSINTKLPSPDADMHPSPQSRTPPPPYLIVPTKFLGLSYSFFLLPSIIRPSEPKMLNLLSSANKTLFQYNIDLAKESLSFLFFALTKNVLRVERPFNPAALKTHRTVSDEIEVENFSLNSAETFKALKRGFFTNYLIMNL
ncbi:hypothetical protein AVEN_111601-1 [Araneus ventricosus]|uniref:Uncharacterized protein n=1 Tax=Araneus ventricosus TaxID=182803 RepID=A0A4Y2C1X7_ARAVE|nr:hypothetical protein AVEN_111601-1 [Araneus ventricosus]